ncbi:MAG: hypothetical protein JSS86_22355, partial [Cyanobacteria bacterium SZAS LIN-2]|nr:hypothetical protein [Cyanobacteria bacterium SZAS LIN-2]
LSPNNERLGGDIGSMTRQLDSFMPANLSENDKASTIKELKSKVMKTNDLVDWVCSFQQSNAIWYYSSDEEKKQLKKEREENAGHCLARWRATHTLPWLVAAITYNNPQDKDKHDLLVAASAVPSQSPAYQTVQYYLIDGLIQAGRSAEAKKHLLPILSRADLTPSSRNLFLSQRLATSGSAAEYLSSAVQTAQATPAYSNTAQMPDNWYALENKSGYFQACSTFANGSVARDINKNLPQSQWLALALNSTLPQALRKNIVRAAWVRSKLLEQDNAQLDNLMMQFHPNLKKELSDYSKAADPSEKRFALACLVFNNYGMSPYVEGGVQRHGLSMKEFDYYQANFWKPFAPEEKAAPKEESEESEYDPFGQGVSFIGSDRIQTMVLGYSKPHLNKVLSAEEKKQAAQERRIIYKNHPSKFLGQAVLEWAAAHPKDPRVPHLLYVVVKLPKWSGQDQSEDQAENKLALGSKYSRKAYVVLHQQYPASRWAKAAPCWY